jgi:NAD(P)H-hydrate epimerase
MEKIDLDAKHIVMTRDQVRAFDGFAINELGVPGVVLMENAGRSCAELIKEKLGCGGRKVCIFCGTGNNGGDGHVIARHLRNKGIEVVVVVCGNRERIKGDAKINLDILERLGQKIEWLDPSDGDAAANVREYGVWADMIVDALFGTGLRGQVSEEYRELIEVVNSLGKPIVAVDIPSGLDCDTGEPLGAAIRAHYTVTFVAVKKGFVANSRARQYTGHVYLASIGVEPGICGWCGGE